MKNYTNHYSVKHSILDVVVIIGISLFALFEIRLFLRIVLENNFLANSIWLFCYSVLLCLSVLYYLHYRFPYYIHIIMLVGVLGVGIRFFQNASPGILLGTIASYMVIPIFYIAVLKKKIDLKVLTKIILIFSIIHLIGVIGDESFLKGGMDTYTVWGDSSVMKNRSTGFVVAPGVLSFMAVFITVYSTVVYKLTSDKMALILVFLGISLGVYSGNRSFLVAISLVLIIILFTLNYNKKAIDKFYDILKYAVFLSIIIGFGVYYYSDLIVQLLSRFSADDLLKTIHTRLEGKAGFIPNIYALINAPVFGPLEYSNTGPYSIYNEVKVTVNNGILSIFVSNGLILGSIYFSFYIRGFYLLWRSVIKGKKKYNELFVLDNALFYCYIGLTIVTITDALLETTLMTLIIVYANTPRLRNYCKNKSRDASFNKHNIERIW